MFSSIIGMIHGSGPDTPVEANSLHDFTVTTASGESLPLSEYKGKVVVIVNVASKCGLTPQYEALQALYTKYKDDGLVILGFPCNQFLYQEPGTDEEIQSFCSLNYGVTFPVFSKINVNGPEALPLYTWLKAQSEDSGPISWNFEKFIINRDGQVVSRVGPRSDPMDMEEQIKAELAKEPTSA
ncbi:glutathione peroxidase, variant [Fonticula alba]|nr:glutathione peroxidase, variant [Fonticula alba]KCV70047.1 glutathione peroxidase, variant [Fonticula alba]|eukprot:XP_009495653.1 glutathione peroxidase, variant [Fonticula alba]